MIVPILPSPRIALFVLSLPLAGHASAHVNSTLVPQIMSQSVCSPRTATVTIRRSRASHSTINSHRVSPSLQRYPPTAQIPIAEHVDRRGPPNAPKSRFRPLEVFVRRPPASVARFEPAGIRKPSQNTKSSRTPCNVRFHRTGHRPSCRDWLLPKNLVSRLTGGRSR